MKKYWLKIKVIFGFFSLLFFLITNVICIGQNIKINGGCIDSDSSIVAWWTLDEDTSSIIHDIIGKKNGVIVNECSHSEGFVGNSISFDGIDDYIAIPDNDLWAFGLKDFTIELWANFNTMSGGSIWHPEDVFISHNDGSGSQRKWWFGVASDGLHFHINAPEIGPKFFPIVPFVPEIGKWYHLAITRSKELYTLFIDGAPVGYENNSDSIANPSAPLTIGQANEPFGGYFNGKIDEVSIYEKALSEKEILAIYQAGSAGKCKELTINTESIPLLKLDNYVSFQFRASLGTPPYSWSIINGNLPNGLVLDTSGILQGIPELCGEFSFTVGVEDEMGEYIEKFFSTEVLLSLPEPQLRISKTGTVAVPGREIDYFILLENIGNVTATDVQVGEILNPYYDSLLSVHPEAVTNVPTLDSTSFVLWFIPEIQPNDNIILSYKIALNPETPLGEIIHGGPVCTTEDVAERWQNCLENLAITTAGCTMCAAGCAFCIPFCSIPSIPTLATCLVCLIPCFDCMVYGSQTGGEGGCLQDYADVINCFMDINDGCVDFQQESISPVDPNEKLVLADKYIQPDQTLVYPIHYENIGEIEAKDIFITDTLDFNLDYSTLEILTPEGCSFNEETGVLRWELYDVNLQPGETDNVLYSIKPKPGLINGTVLRNKANIQFEVFDVFTTNEVFNIIDDSPPTSRMEYLPSITSTEVFYLSWYGSDTLGNIMSYSVFMSVDSGDFEPIISRTTELSTQFTGEYGKSYSFICIAEDSAGNIETKSAMAEAYTLLQLPQEFKILQNSPNPFIDRTVIEYLLPEETEVIIKIYDVAGREIATLSDEIKEQGIHQIIWEPLNIKSGVYFCRLMTPKNTDVIKLIYENYTPR